MILEKSVEAHEQLGSWRHHLQYFFHFSWQDRLFIFCNIFICSQLKIFLLNETLIHSCSLFYSDCVFVASMFISVSTRGSSTSPGQERWHFYTSLYSFWNGIHPYEKWTGKLKVIMSLTISKQKNFWALVHIVTTFCFSSHIVSVVPLQHKSDLRQNAINVPL